MLTTRLPGGAEQTWRPPLAGRIAVAIALGSLLSLPLVTWLIFAQEMTEGAWIAFALTMTAWWVLCWRALAHSVTLTPDTLVIRNILATAHVPLAQITSVGFRRGRLTVTRARGTAVGRQIMASAVYLGASRWSGLHSNADATAEVISAAAGLPPPPPRREIITLTWAWIMFLAAVPCLGLGFYCGLPRPGGSLALDAASPVLYLAGLLMLPPRAGSRPRPPPQTRPASRRRQAALGVR